MKVYRLILFLFAGILCHSSATSQNVSINILTRESGIVQKGKTIFIEVTINNTDAMMMVGVYKLKPSITVSDSLIKIKNDGHNLPTGWEIISNDGAVITFSNGKDIIASGDSRTLLIAIEGKNTGGPVPVSGQVSFTNGVSPGTDPGVLSGDNAADNHSTSSCTVID